ncbi:MAG: hypothetical protein JWQ19_918 [Subtercola sp.]|nr:hypothetical protein [Subtercola sp.]
MSFACTVWLTMVSPGAWYFEGPYFEGEAVDFRLGVLMEFTDAARRRWRRSANGELNLANDEWFAEQRAGNKPGGKVTRLP